MTVLPGFECVRAENVSSDCHMGSGGVQNAKLIAENGGKQSTGRTV